MYKTLFSVVSLIILTCTTAFAGIVKGKVVDDLKEPLEFVNVALYQQGSVTPFKGTISDETGHYQIDDVKDGTYVVKLTFMGYEEQSRTITLNGENGHTANLRTITLKEDRAVLQEVSVATQKAAMKLDIDKKVFDVSQNITTAGLSASEALENIPSVEVDQEGNISLRGSESVTVWINGKAQGLTSDNRGDILQQLPAESIERIEVITNPSSKYSPEGSAGIINIILKRDRKAGYYGGVQLNAGKQDGEDWGGRFGANINYSSGVLEAYANVGLGRRVHGNGSWTEREYVDETTGKAYGFMNNESEGHMKGLNLFGRAGLTWHITQKDEVSVGYMGMFGLQKGKRNTYVTEEGGIYDEYYRWAVQSNKYFDDYNRTRNSYNTDKPQMTSATAGYKHEWSTEHNLEIQGSYHKWHGENETGYEQFRTSSCLVPTGTNTQTTIYKESQTIQQQEMAMGNESWELQADYTRPLGGSAKMEAGYKGSKNHENSPTETRTSFNGSPMAVDEALFNRFIYDSFQHAAYLNYQNRIGKKFGYQVGLRAEYWRTETESYTYAQEHGTEAKNPVYKKDFFKLFPTLFLSYQLPNDQELQLNYTRRMSRPWGGQLNSFKNISDSTSISFGNPELTPAYTNSFELNYLKNWEDHTLSLSAYYRPTTDVMQRVSYMENNVRYQTNENISQELSSGLETILKNKLFRVIDLTTTVNLYYYKLDGGLFNIYEGGKTRQVSVEGSDDFSWNASMMAQVMLPWQLSLQATGRYHAGHVITQGKRDPAGSLDAGLRRAFFDKKLTVSVNGRDLLNSRRFHSYTWANGYREESERWRGGRRIMIQVSYSFGNMGGKKPGKPGERGGSDDDEGGAGMSGGYDM